MNIVEIRDRHDADGGEGTLAILLLLHQTGEGTRYPDGLHFVTKSDEELQVAVMKWGAGTKIDPHVHPPRQRTIETTGEVIVVKTGRVLVDFFNSRREYVDTRVLTSGDVMIFKSGGHSFAFIDDSELVEVKQGPYQYDKDKIKFKL